MKTTIVQYDKFRVKDHTYTIVLIPSAHKSMILYNSKYIHQAIHLCGLAGPYEVERVRGMIESEIEGDLIRQLILEEGLILPTPQFYYVEIPYQALYEGVFHT